MVRTTRIPSTTARCLPDLSTSFGLSYMAGPAPQWEQKLALYSLDLHRGLIKSKGAFVELGIVQRIVPVVGLGMEAEVVCTRYNGESVSSSD